MTDMRHLMNIIESQTAEVPDMERLADLVAEWVETDPLTTAGYGKQKMRLGAAMLEFEQIAARYRLVPDITLYRAFSLSRKDSVALFRGGALTITPRPSDLLESWTSDAMYVWEHASQFGNAVVIRQPAAKLNVFLNLDIFSQAVTGLDSIEGEVLVRPMPLTITPADVDQGED